MHKYGKEENNMRLYFNYLEAKEKLINALDMADDEREEIQQLVNQYPQKASGIDWQNKAQLTFGKGENKEVIGDWTYENLKELLTRESKKDVKKNIRKGVAGVTEGVDYIYVDPPGLKPGVEIFMPLTHKGSAAIGRASRWCTSQEREPSHWKSYTGRGVMFFYILNPGAKDDNKSMLAITIEPDRKSAQTFLKDDSSTSTGIVKTETGVPIEWFQKEVKNIKEKHDAERLKKLNFSSIDKAVVAVQVLMELGYIQLGYSESNIEASMFTSDIAFIWPSTSDVVIKKGIKGKMPMRFNSVKENFIIHDEDITSLEGSPKSVGGMFKATGTAITSLVGGPQIVKGDFHINDCSKLKTLAGGPTEVGGDYDCGDTILSDTAGIAKSIGQDLYLAISASTKITAVPETIGRALYIQELSESKTIDKSVNKLAAVVTDKDEIYRF